MDDLTDLSRPDLERLLYRTLAERDAARRSARLCRELLTEALNRTRGCPRCNPQEDRCPDPTGSPPTTGDESTG